MQGSLRLCAVVYLRQFICWKGKHMNGSIRWVAQKGGKTLASIQHNTATFFKSATPVSSRLKTRLPTDFLPSKSRQHNLTFTKNQLIEVCPISWFISPYLSLAPRPSRQIRQMAYC